MERQEELDMALDYRTNYKKRMLRRNLSVFFGIILIFLIASAVVIYIKPEITKRTTVEMKRAENLEAYKKTSTMMINLAPKKRNENVTYALHEGKVGPEYFDDALFIGDSRTEGFMLYTSLSNIKAYFSKGLSISTIYEEPIVKQEGTEDKITVMEALTKEQYKKIYIMFGVNELGWPYDDLFEEQYTKLVRDVKTLQPDAILYVQNILPISAKRSATDPIYNNGNVDRFNAIIEKMCRKEKVVYLDVASSVRGEDGCLPPGASVDGVHCNKQYCEIWLEYLMNNTYEVKEN